MPEIPELTVISRVLNARVQGQGITSVNVRIPVVIRRPSVQEFTGILTGNTWLETRRVGKYLLTTLSSGHVLAINLMLTGRLQLAPKQAKLMGRTSWVITFDSGLELRYGGAQLDGRVYLLPVDQLGLIPNFAEMGPDVLDPSLTFETFRQRLKKRPGQIKRGLVDAAVVAGTGNAYADEILWEARIYPFEPARNLSEQQLRTLFESIHNVYAWAVPEAAGAMGDTLEHKARGFLRVHRKGGEPCPRCGTTITEVAPNQRITSYCRTCQPGSDAVSPGALTRRVRQTIPKSH